MSLQPPPQPRETNPLVYVILVTVALVAFLMLWLVILPVVAG